MPRITDPVVATINIGDRVRTKAGMDQDDWSGEGIVVAFEGETVIINRLTNYHAVEGARWAVRREKLEVIAPEKKIKATAENTVNVQLERRSNGKTYFSFKVPPKIIELYKEKSDEVRESKNWTGLKFYAIPSLLSDEKYQRALAGYNLFDDFGDGFIKIAGSQYRLNIAWIRTVSGEGEFEVKNEIGHSELNMLVKNMLEFLKTYFEDHFRQFAIKGSLTIDF